MFQFDLRILTKDTKQGFTAFPKKQGTFVISEEKKEKKNIIKKSRSLENLNETLILN